MCGGECVGGECVWRGGVCVESAWGVSGGQGGGKPEIICEKKCQKNVPNI